MRMKAHRLKTIDKHYEMHLQAWLNHVVGATEEKGKKQVPVYKKFDDFFDYEKQLREVNGTKEHRLTPKQRQLARLAEKVNKGG